MAIYKSATEKHDDDDGIQFIYRDSCVTFYSRKLVVTH